VECAEQPTAVWSRSGGRHRRGAPVPVQLGASLARFDRPAPRGRKRRLQNIFEGIKASDIKLGGRIAGMWLYGSFARQEDHAGSDVDIGLIARPDDLAEIVEAVREHLRETSERLFFLPNVVGLDFNDLKRVARDDDPWWKSCIADGFVLLGNHPEDIAQELLTERRDGQERAEQKKRGKRLSGTAPNRQRFLEGCEKQQRRGGSWQHRRSVQCLHPLIAPSYSPTSSPPSKSARPTKTITRRW